MGTLASELSPFADRLTDRPRVYADANVPAGLIRFMRERLKWDVLFVMEEEELRRLPDAGHYQLARKLRRTLVTLDRDYLDDRRFPPLEGAGVLVLSAPHEEQFVRLLRRLNTALFERPPETSSSRHETLPLLGRKLHAHVDWQAESGDKAGQR